MTKIKVITGSNRPGRFNIQPAEWIFNLAKERGDIEVELLDLEKINLPFIDEPATPKQNKYTKKHTKDWSAKIAEADGFIFVTPEYNHSFSAVLKNAIDYLFYEWNWKPVAFISYGTVGGARAVEHLTGVARELNMLPLRDGVMIAGYWHNLDENGKYKFSEADANAAKAMLDHLSFWAGEMKASRAKMEQMSKQ
ncbi:MAG TPA: NAD(P)H-dependent oxidoreductase [Candidatus Paceibacterota bacterium]|jgi:NAD(P)H-dependent FMN reductase|nr:NAD(P)H-dependent oxidoreductase [Candidatus Paceibacterota bacterium]